MKHFKDISNQRFDRLVALFPEEHAKDHRAMWHCRCDCGKEIVVTGKSLRNGKRTSCGCKRKEFGKRILIDMAGKTYGFITVTKRHPSNGRKRSPLWECECICGKRFVSDGYPIRNGNTTSCGCRRGEKQIRTQSGFRNLFAQYRSRAKTYKLPFTLDDASFLLFTSSNCYYCGTPPTRTRTSSQDHSPYAWNGIDRIDSGRGYELWNCVPSCLPCNMAKSAMTPSEFQDWLDRISEYHSNQFRSINAAAEILSQCA